MEGNEIDSKLLESEGYIQGDSCKVCDLKCFSRQTFVTHCQTDEHKKRKLLRDFLNNQSQYVVGTEPATAQSIFDLSTEVIIGLNEIYEMYHPATSCRFWICGVCYCGVSNSSHIHHHVQGVKHKKRLIECRYPDRKERIWNRKEMSEWLDRGVNDIASVEGKGRIKHAMVLAEIPEILASVGLAGGGSNNSDNNSNNGSSSGESSASAESASISKQESASIGDSGTTPTTIVEKSEPAAIAADPKGASSTDHKTADQKSTRQNRKVGGDQKSEETPVFILENGGDVAMQCEICWDILITNPKEQNAVWQKHITSQIHLKNRETRKLWDFKPEYFTNDDPSEKLVKAMAGLPKLSDVMIVGLHDFIETRIANRDVIDVVCLICACKFVHEKYFRLHLTSRTHMMKYINKHYPEAVPTTFRGYSNITGAEMVRFLQGKGEPRAGTIRVYDPSQKKSSSSAESSKNRPSSNSNSKQIDRKESSSSKSSSAPGAAAKRTAELGKLVQAALNKAGGVPIQPMPTWGLGQANKSAAAPVPLIPKYSGGSTTLMDTIITKIVDKPSPVAADTFITNSSTELTSPAAITNDQVERFIDQSIRLLMASPTEPIPIRYHAFAQPILDSCKDALIGVEFLCEYCAIDPIYEPGYICKLCAFRCNCNVLIEHLASADHRLKYFEKNHPMIFQSLTAGTSMGQKSILQTLAIKQHAQVLEMNEGRSRVSQRLVVKVEQPEAYGMRKRMAAAFGGPQSFSFSSASSSLPPRPPPFYFGGGLTMAPPNSTPFSGVPPTSFPPPTRPLNQQQQQQSGIGIGGGDPLPPGVSASSSTITTSLLDRVAKPPPMLNDGLLPPGISAFGDLPSLSSSSDGTTAGGGAKQQQHWSAQCDQFLAKLSSSGDTKKNIPSGGATTTTKSDADNKKKDPSSTSTTKAVESPKTPATVAAAQKPPQSKESAQSKSSSSSTKSPTKSVEKKQQDKPKPKSSQSQQEKKESSSNKEKEQSKSSQSQEKKESSSNKEKEQSKSSKTSSTTTPIQKKSSESVSTSSKEQEQSSRRKSDRSPARRSRSRSKSRRRSRSKRKSRSKSRSRSRSRRRRSRSRSRSKRKRSTKTRSRSRSRSRSRRRGGRGEDDEKSSSSNSKRREDRSSGGTGGTASKSSSSAAAAATTKSSPSKKKLERDDGERESRTKSPAAAAAKTATAGWKRIVEKLENEKKQSKKARVEDDVSPPPSSAATGIGQLDLPADMLMKLLTQHLAKEKAAAAAAARTDALGLLLDQWRNENPTPPTASRGGDDMIQRLASILGNKAKPAAARKVTAAAAIRASAGSAGNMELLIQLLAEEEERKRKQEEQKNAIIALLTSGGGGGPSSAGLNTAAASAATIIDYDHGTSSTTTDSSTSGGRPSHSHSQSNPGDDLVSEAMRNVLKAQAAKGGPANKQQQQQQQQPPQPTQRSSSIRPSIVTTLPPPNLIRGGPFLNNNNNPRPVFIPQQQPAAVANQQAIVNAAAAMLLTSLFNNQSSAPQRRN